MKVLVINSSNNMDKGNTALILNPFINGMRKAGATVEIFFTKELNIQPCQCKFDCWLKTPGECWIQDDMRFLLPKIAEASILVLATPVQINGVSGPMKDLLDRTLPLVYPFFVMENGRSIHPKRKNLKVNKLVLVSNCGFWETEHFEPLLKHMNAFAKNMLGCEFAGALLRPHGPALRDMLDKGIPVDYIFNAAEKAGLEIISQGTIPDETLEIVSKELLPLHLYIQWCNYDFQNVLNSLEENVL